MPGTSDAQASLSRLAEAVAQAGVTDRAVLDAFHGVPRAAFVPHVQLGHAYQDRPVEIPHGQVTTQQVPAPLVEQLAEGGRLVHPLGRGGGEDVVCFEKRGADPVRLESVTPARFVPLRTDDRRR